jgi:hypothetical protein
MAPFTCGNVAILIKIAQRATSNGAIYLRQCRNFDKDLRQGPQVFAQNLNKMRQWPQVIAQNLNKMRQVPQVIAQLLAEMSEF